MNRLALVAVTLAACGKGKSGPDITPASFGSKPVPPGRLTKIKPDMTQAEIKALYPDNRPTPNHSGSPSLTIDSDFGNADYRIGFYSDIDKVASVDVEVPSDMKIGDELKKAWGPAKETMSGMLEWRNEEDGYEVTLWEKHRTAAVQFKPFIPLTVEYFGKTPGPIGELAKLKWDMSWEQVKAAVPGIEGPKGGSGGWIPFKSKPDKVTLDVGYSDDKLDRMSLEMPVRGLALLTKAWGAPTPGKDGQCWETADKTMWIRVRTPGEGAEDTHVYFEKPLGAFCD